MLQACVEYNSTELKIQMVEKLIDRGKKILFGPQSSILSAATVIMAMMLFSRVLGYVRQRVILHYFVPSESSLFFAAFRLPDLIFEVLVFGTFSSAFIPVFAKLIKRGNGDAWDTAGRVVNIGLSFFIPIAVVVSIFAFPIYRLIAPGFTIEETYKIAEIARILFVAQGFFIVSYVLTGVLESLHRFLIPALAPVFYNIGIILGIIILSPTLGLIGPALGVVIGASLHFLIQLPLSSKMGFRFVWGIKPTPEVRKIGKLAAPRLVDLCFQQVSKVVELNLSSLISSASYTYLTLANTLQLLPVSLLGTTIAKAALPTLSEQSEDKSVFAKTLLTTIYQVMFLISPIAALFIVLRIPIVRLAYGTDLFDWNSTIETSLVLSAFAIAIPFQAVLAILNRAYYAMHDTKTPVMVSIGGILITITSALIMVKGYNLPVWSLGAAFSAGIIIQTTALFSILKFKIEEIKLSTAFWPIGKSIFASVVSGIVVFFLLKIFDRSVWVKRLSFLTLTDIAKGVDFEKFVLDTRYTFNLAILTIGVSLVGAVVYILLSWILRSNELKVFFRVVRKLSFKVDSHDQEMLSPSTGD